ncbi:MAG: transglycosylase domain-containing protein [Anaerolineales bacterium]
MHRSPLLRVRSIIKGRRTRKKKRQRSFAERTLRAAALALGAMSLATAIIALAALPLYLYVTQGLPSVVRLEELLRPLSGELLQPTRLYDRSGQQVLLSLEPQEASRAFLRIENQYLLDAFVASQDPHFWTRPAGDLLDLDGGPNGIAESLTARLLLPSDAEGWLKTLRARLLANEATARYGREQILVWSLNSAYFGHWAFGVESAAQLYLGKPAADLSLGEAALLAAVAQAPALNPFDAPELAVQYQRLVLSAMRDQGLITDTEFTTAFVAALVFAPASGPQSLAPDFTELVLQQLEMEFGQDRLQLGGLKVVTTLDFSLEREISALLESAGAQVDGVVLDPLNGQILALQASGDDHVTERILAPFAYMTLFAQGEAPASLIWTAHGPTTLRAALAAAEPAPGESLSASAKVTDALGLQANRGHSLLQVAASYGVLANSGLLVGIDAEDQLTPTSILFVGDLQDRVLLNRIRGQVQVVASPELTALVTDVLTDASVRMGDAIAWGTLGRSFAFLQADDAGSGTWQVGYSPQRVIGLWFEEGSEAEDIWAALFQAAHRDLPIRSWEVPADLTSIIVCVPSGQLPDEDCPATRREWFLAGTEPTESDTLYERIAINSLNGKLATVFTPEEFVEERVYLMVSPSAERWARAAGIALAPEDYDPIPFFAGQSSAVSILDPLPFSEVDGQVGITALLGAGAVTFEVQVGEGLRPTEWFTVAEGRVPAGNRITIEWDASALSGLWSVQLQAWDEAGNLMRGYTVVTIVN